MLKITPKHKKYELLEEFEYKGVKVPKGFTTDGATMKLKILHIFMNKFDPRIIEACVIHDYLCEKEQYTLADKYFEELLPKIWQTKYMVMAVKFWHKIKDNKR